MIGHGKPFGLTKNPPWTLLPRPPVTASFEGRDHFNENVFLYLWFFTLVLVVVVASSLLLRSALFVCI